MIINALNSGANAYMADFEDSSSPTWDNMISGQINLRDAVEKTIEFTDTRKGKVYRLQEQTAVLIVRPRGWHLPESNLLVDGQPISGSIFDFGLYFFHNVQNLLKNGTGPYFYLPKLENRHEAALWNQVFVAAQQALGVPVGTIKTTVLIETILAAFEMDEILYALRDHIVALNCGRWDYIFSFIKKFGRCPDFVLPDRAQVTMTSHFLRSYSLLTIKTCHRRGAMAMGGMAAQIPIKDDPEANQKALSKVQGDKEREANDGHDGTWVAHPGLVPLAREVFDRLMPGSNQLSVLREDVNVTADDLLQLPKGKITEMGVRTNIRVGILYLTAWLEGNGCVPLHNLMEDAATAEISRVQIWQWLRHQAQLNDGRIFNQSLFERVFSHEVEILRRSVTSNCLDQAIALFKELVTARQCEEFLTLAAYSYLL
jgi:malate synthase